MKTAVKKIAEQIKALPESELDEFLSWLEEYEMGHSDAWDKEIERDSQEGGHLSSVLPRERPSRLIKSSTTPDF
jgi:hypothetical protein